MFSYTSSFKMKNTFKTPKNGKSKNGFKKRANKCIVTFDENERQEYLTGFHKRKLERRKAAVVEIKNKIKEEQKKVREERHKEYMKLLKERKEALDEDEDEDELEDVITGTTESMQYDHPNHTVTVTTISDLDLTGAGFLELPANQRDEGSDEEKKEGEEKGEGKEELEKKTAMPKKSGDPILNKKICSLTASLHSHIKQKKRKGRKGKQQEQEQEGKGRGRPSNRKSGSKDRKSGGADRKSKPGRTTKKQRRRQTGKRVHHKD